MKIDISITRTKSIMIFEEKINFIEICFLSLMPEMIDKINTDRRWRQGSALALNRLQSLNSSLLFLSYPLQWLFLCYFLLQILFKNFGHVLQIRVNNEYYTLFLVFDKNIVIYVSNHEWHLKSFLYRFSMKMYLRNFIHFKLKFWTNG